MNYLIQCPQLFEFAFGRRPGTLSAINTNRSFACLSVYRVAESIWLKSQPHYWRILTKFGRKVSVKLLGASICGLSLFLDEGRRKEAHERTLEQQHRVPGLESFILDHARLCSAKIYDSGGSLSTLWSAFRPISSSPPWKQVLKDVDH